MCAQLKHSFSVFPEMHKPDTTFDIEVCFQGTMRLRGVHQRREGEAVQGCITEFAIPPRVCLLVLGPFDK